MQLDSLYDLSKDGMIAFFIFVVIFALVPTIIFIMLDIMANIFFSMSLPTLARSWWGTITERLSHTRFHPVRLSPSATQIILAHTDQDPYAATAISEAISNSLRRKHEGGADALALITPGCGLKQRWNYHKKTIHAYVSAENIDYNDNGLFINRSLLPQSEIYRLANLKTRIALDSIIEVPFISTGFMIDPDQIIISQDGGLQIKIPHYGMSVKEMKDMLLKIGVHARSK